LVCFPEKADIEILERILAGGLSKMIEARCTVVGGHSIRDEETKFGYSVTGIVHPKRVLANQGARSGDKLLFTKSLGTGVISTAIKKGVAKQEWIDAAVKSMTTLNKTAAEVIAAHTGIAIPGRPAEPISASTIPTTHQANDNPRTADDDVSVHALTDVTGFGLIGHAREIARASNVSLIFHSGKIPVLEGALECIHAGHIPAGLKANRDFAECVVAYDESVPADIRTLLFDPQTAGGLLISVSANAAHRLISALQAAEVPAVEIGEVISQTKPLIQVTA
jgi:selenide,water dikinase